MPGFVIRGHGQNVQYARSIIRPRLQQFRVPTSGNFTGLAELPSTNSRSQVAPKSLQVVKGKVLTR